MTFEFATATRILFGPGKRHELFPAAKTLGSCALLVTGADTARAEWALEGLHQAGIAVELFPISTEPTLQQIEEGRRRTLSSGAGFVVAVGGGSAIDAGKAIAALAANDEDVLYYLEVIGSAKPLTRDSLPFIAIPTTAGTGAEVTRNAVLHSVQHQVKVSLRSPRMLPTLAIVDPQLAHDLPPSLTASTGMDALTQTIEPFLSSRANPIVDALCREAMPRIARALPVAFREPHNAAAREDLAFGSLIGGIALANSGLGAVHGFAAPIGGMFPAPHGAVCAALLPSVLETNLRSVQRAQNNPSLARFEELGRLLTGKSTATARHAIDFVRGLIEALKIPRLSGYGIESTHVALLCERAAQASSMKANPANLEPAELVAILSDAL